jgi:hypothetical protein
MVSPAGGEMASRPVCAKAATRRAPGVVVVTEGAMIPFELRVIRPPAASIGWTRSTAE